VISFAVGRKLQFEKFMGRDFGLFEIDAGSEMIRQRMMQEGILIVALCIFILAFLMKKQQCQAVPSQAVSDKDVE